jgi:hypothetical protein
VLPTTSVTGYGPATAQDVVIDVSTRVGTANFVLPALPGDLFGTVTVTGGTTVEGIHVEATPVTGGTTVSDDTAADGTYRIEDLRHGTYNVRFSGDSVREVTRTVTISKGTDSQLDETLVSRTTTISVLADATYGSANSPQPLAGATVTLFQAGSTSPLVRSGLTNPATTGVDGTTSFPGLPDGGYRVQIAMTGYQSVPSQTVNALGGFQDVDFHLRSVDRPSTLRIVSAAASTAGIPNIPVTFTPTAASPGRPTVVDLGTNSSGVAEVTLPHGTYTVSIGEAPTPAPPAPPPKKHETTVLATSGCPTGTTCATITVAPTATADAFAAPDFAIQEARITAAFSAQGGTPTEFRVRIFLARSATGTPRETRRPSTAGTEEFFVPAGSDVTVVADVEADSTFGPASSTITAGAVGSTTATSALVVRKQGAAGVRVLNRAGQPIRDVAVTLDGVTVDTGADGMATFTGRTPGSYTATAVEPGYTTNTASVTIAPGQTAGTASAPDATITLTGDRQTRIVVNNENGSNLNGAAVSLNGGTPVVTTGGRADFSTLDPGTYTLKVVAVGYQDHTETITISPTQTLNSDGNTVVNMQLIVTPPAPN